MTVADAGQAAFATDLGARGTPARQRRVAGASTLWVALVYGAVAIIVDVIAALGAGRVLSGALERPVTAHLRAGATAAGFAGVAGAAGLGLILVRASVAVVVVAVTPLRFGRAPVSAGGVLAHPALPTEGTDPADAVGVHETDRADVAPAAVSAAVYVGLATVLAPVVTGRVRTQSHLRVTGPAHAVSPHAAALTRDAGAAVASTVQVRLVAVEHRVVAPGRLTGQPPEPEVADPALAILAGAAIASVLTPRAAAPAVEVRLVPVDDAVVARRRRAAAVGADPAGAIDVPCAPKPGTASGAQPPAVHVHLASVAYPIVAGGRSALAGAR